MSKKVVFSILAVLTFFIGSILVDNFPLTAPLIIFFAVGIGFTLGYFFMKDTVNEKLSFKEAENSILTATNLKLKTERSVMLNQIEALQQSLAAKEKPKKAKKVKEEPVEGE